MKRVSTIAAGALVVLLCAFGQVSRDAYRTAYRAWKMADPNLERDAAAGGPPLAERAEHLVEPAKNYGVERSAFLQHLANVTQRDLGWLQSPPAEPLPDLTKAAAARVTAEMVAVQRTINTYASDPDPGIQRVRAMLERENLALSALSNAVKEHQNIADAAKAASAAMKIVQAKALEKDREFVSGLSQAIVDSDRETVAWTMYYKLVADGARTPVEAPVTSAPEPAAIATATPTSPAAPQPPTVTTPAPLTPEPIPSATPAQAAAAPPPLPAPPPPPEPVKPDAATSPPSPPAPRSSGITPVPLVRYIGEWTLPQIKPLFHGPQPESMDLIVTEENGHASGTLIARFKLPAGSTNDPAVRFSFSGDFRNARNQVFEAQASDGSKGRLELIPGSAFNLLEINFLLETQPGKISQANVVLIKK